MSLARAVLPTVTQRTIMQAWDRSRGIGGGGDANAAYDPESPRVQGASPPGSPSAATDVLVLTAAINLIFELHPPTPPRQAPKPPPQPIVAPPPPVLFEPAVYFKAPVVAPAPRRVLFAEPENDPFHVLPPPQPVAGPASKARKVRRQRVFNANVIEIADSSEDDDDDDDDAVVFVEKGKGKGKAEPVDDGEVHLRAEFQRAVDAVQLDDEQLARQERFQLAVNAREQQSTTDIALAAILNVLPDVLPSHALSLLAQGLTIEAVLEALFADENGYPKLEPGAAKGKKRERSVELLEHDDDERDWMDVAGRERQGKVYEEAACVHSSLLTLMDRRLTESTGSTRCTSRTTASASPRSARRSLPPARSSPPRSPRSKLRWTETRPSVGTRCSARAGPRRRARRARSSASSSRRSAGGS